MATSVYFNGETIKIPGVYSAIDASGMATKNSDVTTKIIAIIGESEGGEPHAVHLFDNPVAAKKTLKSGDLLKACEKAWNPVSGTKVGLSLGGAHIIATVRSNKATKSTLDIQKSGLDQLKFSSKDWGSKTKYAVRIGNGTLSSTKSVVVKDELNDINERFDNIGNLFTVKYTGAQPYAVINIEQSVDNKMKLVTKIGTNESDAIEDIVIDLDTKVIKSIGSLMSTIQTFDGYQVSSNNYYNSRIKVNELDLMKNVDITQEQRVTAVFADMKDKLDLNSSLISLDSYDKTLGTISNFEFTNLAGGTDGVSPSSWVKLFDLLSNYDITYIVPLTPDQAIHAELQSHVEKLSGNLGKERRAIVGGNAQETTKETAFRARTINSERVQVVHGGFYDYNSSNELELYAPYILAAAHAGRAAFLEDGESATHDVYRMAGPEYKLERDEISELLDAGALAFEFVLASDGSNNSFVRLVQDLTTDTYHTDSIHTERATGALADSINKEIRTKLDSLLTGKRTSNSDLTSAKNAIISILSARKLKNQIVAYKDIYLTKTATTTTVDYSVAPAEVNNFTLITGHYYSETLTESGATSND